MKNYNSDYVFSSTINAALGSFFFGYINSVFNPLQKYIQQNVYENDISENLIYLMTSLVPAGAAIGAIMSTNIAFKYGRRNAMLITDAISILAVIMTLVQDKYFLLTGRLISGVCIGLNSSLVPLYISEMSPVQVKGVTGTFTQIAVSIGILLSYIFGLNVPSVKDRTPSVWWRFMLGFPILLAVVRSGLLLTKFKYDTPKYLVLTGAEEEANRVIDEIYARHVRKEQLTLLKKEKQAESQAGKITYADLFTFRYSTRLKVGCFIAILQQLSGINAIIYYSTLIFSQNVTDPNSNLPQVYTMVVGILNLASAFIAMGLIGKMGRRQLLLLGTSILFISLLLLPVTSFAMPDATGLSKYFIFSYILGFGFSLGSVTWIYISEILPDLGVGIAVLSSWVACFFVAQVFPYLNKYVGQSGAFLVFASFCFVGLLLISQWVKETKGKLPHEIATMFTEGRKNSTENQNLKNSNSDSNEDL